MSTLSRILIWTLVMLGSNLNCHAQAQKKEIEYLKKEATRLYDSGKIEDAIRMAIRIHDLSVGQFGRNHPKVADIFSFIAGLYEAWGLPANAEPFLKDALKINETTFGPNHPKASSSILRLAVFFENQGRIVEAEKLLKRSLAITETAFGPEDHRTGINISSLAELYKNQGRFAEAESLFKRALAIAEIAHGPDDPEVGANLNSLTTLFGFQGRFDEAIRLQKRSLAITEKSFGPDHQFVATGYNNLAVHYRDMGRYSEAEKHFKQALKIFENKRGPDHPEVGFVKSTLASLYYRQGRFEKARTHLKSALAITEKAYGPNHSRIAIFLTSMGSIYRDQGYKYASEGDTKRAWSNYAKSERSYKRASAIFEDNLGSDHPLLRNNLIELFRLYRILKQPAQQSIIRHRLDQMPAPGTRNVPLFFTTNRNLSPKGQFGGDLSSQVRFGHVIVNVPAKQVINRANRIGESSGQLENANSGKLTSADRLKISNGRLIGSQEELIGRIRASQTRAVSFKNQALIFVHGYNNSFNGAMKRATQLSFDLQFDGILIPFTWPSQGLVQSYLIDQKMATNSVDSLVETLKLLHKSLPEIKIHILAHSLGNRVMLSALCKFAKQNRKIKRKLGQVVSAHADISTVDFVRLTACFKSHVEGITLYVNEEDIALRARCATLFRCRAGNYARGYKTTDVIDTTQMSKGFFRSLTKGFDHDVFVRNPLLFSDISRLLLTGERPVQKRTREFRPKKDDLGHVYWIYDKSYDISENPIATSNN